MAKINCWLKRRGSTKLSDDLEHVLKIAQTMNTFITSPLTGCLPNKESEVDYKINAFLDSCKWEMEFEHLFRHVIEIYDFPAIFETDDLVDAFAECSDGGMKIKWVDNTHALGVFASEAAGESRCYTFVTRSLAEGSKKAQATAIRSAEFIQPVKERPKTDCAVAQRMVTRALGLQRGGRVRDLIADGKRMRQCSRLFRGGM
uniref:R3H domain and coiled-coil containing 1 n=1 Tax=Mola mola TaxID=94237 RepID=A0A3Q3VXD9_MOLML